LACAGVVGSHLFLWAPAVPYATGALFASAAWWAYALMLQTAGVATKRSGILGEEWTSQELRRLRRHGWVTVNHVMLERVDVDHAAIGPGGFLVIDSKFRSEWPLKDEELQGMVDAAWNSSDRVAGRMRVHPRRVQPIVVMWAPDSDSVPELFVQTGVTFCPGWELRQFITALPAVCSADDTRAAFNHLDSYVHKRDKREMETDGDLPQTISQIINSWVAVVVLTIGAALTVLGAANIRPRPTWAVVAASVLTAGGLVIRRKWEARRVMYMTTAVVTTALALGVVLFGGVVLELVR